MMRVMKPKVAPKQQVILDAKSFREPPEVGSIICQNFQPQFEKSIKQHVLISKDDFQQKPSITLSSLQMKINPQKLIIQIYLIEKLKLIICAADQNEKLYQFTVCPKQTMINRSKEEITIASSFILTKKWISLCIDFQSFFNANQLVLRSLQINSQCKLKQIYESAVLIQTISDGQFMIQRINQKRIQELVDNQNRCSTQDRPSRKTLVIKHQSSMKERSKSIEPKEIFLPQVYIKSKVEIIIQKNVKIATGLQVIEEIQRKKVPGLRTQELKHTKIETDFKIKAVKSFMRHSDYLSPMSEQKLQPFEKISGSERQSIELKDEFYNNLKLDQKEKISTMDDQQDFESSYNSRVYKFSNTFQKPLGFSSMNFKLAQQNSNTFTQLQQHSTQDYFYLSSQQFKQDIVSAQEEIAQSHLTDSQVEEKIEVEDKEDKEDMRSVSLLSSRKNDSSEVVVSQFV